MRFMVLTEKDRGELRSLHPPAEDGQLLLQEIFQKQLLLQPDRHCLHEGADSARGEAEIGLQEPLKFDQRLVVEDDVLKIP